MNLSKATVSMSLSIDPVTLVNISVRMNKSTFTVVFLVFSLTLVDSSILEFYFTDSFPLSDFLTAVLTFVFVFGATWVCDWCPVVVPDVE